MKLNKYDEDIGFILFLVGIVLVFVLSGYSIDYIRYDQDCLDAERITVTANDYTLYNMYISDEKLPYTVSYGGLYNYENATNPNHIAFRVYDNITDETLRIEIEYNQTMTGKEYNQSFYKLNCKRF